MAPRTVFTTLIVTVGAVIVAIWARNADAIELNEGTDLLKVRLPRDADADYEIGSPRKVPKSRRPKAGPGEIELPEDYNIYQIPKHPSGEPMRLGINLYLRKILDFDELQEEIKVDLEFRVIWTDYEILMFNQKKGEKYGNNTEALRTISDLTPDEIREKKVTLNNPNLLEKIWKPNLFFENLLTVRQPHVMALPVTIECIPEVGWFEYLTRITVTLDCGMEFHYYPADTQSCEFSIRGFSYVRKDLNLTWHESGVYLGDLNLPSFDVKVDDLHEYYLVDDDSNTHPDSLFGVLAFTVYARRRLSYHLVQTYLASTFYIIITCLCFLLPARMVEARIGISMTTLLTLTAMFAAVRESTPIVSYVKAIDIWMVGCIFFVFLTLSQFTFYTWLAGTKEDLEKKEENGLHKKRDKERTPPSERRGSTGHPTDTGTNMELVELRQRKKSGQSPRRSSTIFRNSTLQKYERVSNFVERFSFPIFLSIFAVYSIVYWIWLMTSADYFNWVVNETLNNLEDTNPDIIKVLPTG